MPSFIQKSANRKWQGVNCSIDLSGKAILILRKIRRSRIYICNEESLFRDIFNGRRIRGKRKVRDLGAQVRVSLQLQFTPVFHLLRTKLKSMGAAGYINAVQTVMGVALSASLKAQAIQIYDFRTGEIRNVLEA